MANGGGTRQEWAADLRWQGYRDAVIARAVSELAPLAVANGDTEAAHYDADDILCAALVSFGARAIVDAYELVPKWYA